MNEQFTRVIISTLFAVMLASCSTTPEPRFYTLGAVAPTAQGGQVTMDNKVLLGISPVDISPYLDRSEIVTRSGSTQVKLATYDRWAEPLEDMIASAVAENIVRLKPATRAIARPWPEAEVDYMLAIKIKRFDADAKGNIELAASWGIIEQKARKMKTIRESVIRQQGSGADFDAIAQAMSKALLALSSEIAKELEY
jgi:uncharacterized lipoprotein YmbA